MMPEAELSMLDESEDDWGDNKDDPSNANQERKDGSSEERTDGDGVDDAVASEPKSILTAKLDVDHLNCHLESSVGKDVLEGDSQCKKEASQGDNGINNKYENCVDPCFNCEINIDGDSCNIENAGASKTIFGLAMSKSEALV
eukprot:UC4_evm1s364